MHIIGKYQAVFTILELKWLFKLLSMVSVYMQVEERSQKL